MASVDFDSDSLIYFESNRRRALARRMESRRMVTWNGKGKNVVWLEEAQGWIKVVAPLILTLTFLVYINPPGGIVQAEPNTAPAPNAPTPSALVPKGQKLGTSALSYDADLKLSYYMFMVFCTASFSGCALVILLKMAGLICGFILNNRTLRGCSLQSLTFPYSLLWEPLECLC